MEREPFFSLLAECSRRNRSLLCVGIDPQLDQVPAGELVSFGSSIVDATREAACAYKLNIAFFEARGVEGLAALRATVDYIHGAGYPVILDAKRGDISSSAAAYARASFEAWGADAVTVNPLLGGDAVESFSAHAGRGVFVLCHTSNPGARDLQELETEGIPLYERIAALAGSWNARGNVGLVIGATYPAVIERVRRIVPHMWFLLPGIGAQGGDLERSVRAGVTAEGSGVLVNVSRGISGAPDPRAAALGYRDRINHARATAEGQELTRPDSLQEALALGLHDLGAVRFGEATLISSLKSSVSIDLRLLVSDPKLMSLAARALAGLLSGLRFDRIAAIPYAGLPIGLAVSLESGKPFLYPREVEDFGTKKAIEGHFEPGEIAVILDDLITTGGSAVGAVESLLDAGLSVHDVVVLVDREQGGAKELAERGFTLHSVLTISLLLEILARRGRIRETVRADVLRVLGLR